MAIIELPLPAINDSLQSHTNFHSYLHSLVVRSIKSQLGKLFRCDLHTHIHIHTHSAISIDVKTVEAKENCRFDCFKIIYKGPFKFLLLNPGTMVLSRLFACFIRPYKYVGYVFVFRHKWIKGILQFKCNLLVAISCIVVIMRTLVDAGNWLDKGKFVWNIV